ncbi:MAG: MBL fold metallo-hydrolase [Lactobacillales bacterium]|nr:MBL fold metallo-hydrolase [Lactobacillales bacterium]
MIEIGVVYNEVAGENTYFIYNEAHVLIIDPGSETEQILEAIKTLGRKPVAILLTHTHYDHIMSVEAIRGAYPSIPVYVSPREEKWLGNPELNLSGLPRHDEIEDVIVAPAEFTFENYKEYTLGEMTFKVLPTPGHSIGGVSFLFDDFVITGDALFKGSIGRTDLNTGDMEMLLNSIQTELFTLPNHLAAFPGHGAPTTIEHEKEYNPFFR